MSQAYNTELQARVEKYRKEKKLTLEAAAKQMNLGGKTKLGLWLKSNYGPGSAFGKGDVAGLEQKITEFFRIQDAQAALPSSSSPMTVGPERYVPTSLSRQMYNMIEYTQMVKGVGIIHGDSGIGKTVTAAKYALDNPASAIFLPVNPVTGVLSRFIRKLANEMKIPGSRDLGYLVEEIEARLMNTNVVLIIDEAQNLKYTTMELITRWTDPHPLTHKPGIGIVLVGNSQIYDRMGRNNRTGQYEQQRNRSRPMAFSRTKLTRDDVAMLFHGVDEPGREKEAEFLYNLCQHELALRNAVNIWNEAVDNKDVSCAQLQLIARNRGILVA